MHKPFVLKNMINSWPSMNWTPQSLADTLSQKQLRIRLGPKSHNPGTVLWETNSPHVDATLTQFLAWSNRDPNMDIGPLSQYDPNQYWAYVDYKYMFDLFDDSNGMPYLEAIDWGRTFGCGLENRNGVDSTFWMGTKGSYTPCHYDTYGFNLVAQLYGRKRWILFPPHDYLMPTRLPYEESSVFSCLDFISPRANLLLHTHPHVITLEPGDMLFVPQKWWHFVQSISDTTISVNTWVDTPTQDREAVKLEALTQVLVSILSTSTSCDDLRTFVIPNTSVQCEPGDAATLDLDSTLDQFNGVLGDQNRSTSNTILDDFIAQWRPHGLEVQEMKDIDEFCKSQLDNSVLDIRPVELKLDHGSSGRVIRKMDIVKAITNPDVVNMIYNCCMRYNNLD